MSFKGMMRTSMWTEIRDAIIADFPELTVPIKAPKNIEAVVKSNADYIAEIVGQS